MADAPSPALVVPCRVIEIVDGDTITVEMCLRARVRLLDCWAPELRQAGGPEAHNRLRALAGGKQGLLHIDLSGRRLDDIMSFGRILGRVWVDGRNLSETMVSEGLATETKQ